MTKKSLAVVVALFAVLFLQACAIRNTGPCYGYGCPAMSSSHPTNASNRTSPPQGTAAVAASKPAVAQSATLSGK
jgi:hypothetical protein